MTTPSSVDPSSNLPSLLACLSTAAATSKPPPALLPLLSPILLQRVQLLSESADSKSWLPLANWNDQEALQLVKIFEAAALEPHPASGEVEPGEVEPTKFRRIDEETLQALVSLPDVGFSIIYTWCTTEGKSNWRVAEVKPAHCSWSQNPVSWESSVNGAEEAFESKTHTSAVAAQQTNGGAGEDEEDDDDYWDRYDNTPGRTPARTPDVTRQPTAQRHASNLKQSSTADESYWGQYAAVQPALDSDDPDERAASLGQVGESGLDGNALLQAALASQRNGTGAAVTDGALKREEYADPHLSLYTPNGTSTKGRYGIFPATAPEMRHSPAEHSYGHIQQPRPQSAQSVGGSSNSSSRLVEQLEDQAELETSKKGISNSATDFAVQQHISTSIKSLYRLSQAAGIERQEFERIVQAELGVLSMLENA